MSLCAAVRPNGPLRALGHVTIDESTRFQVTARTEGRLEHLWIKQTGDMVGSGQRVASLYSPELLAAQRGILTARSKPGTAAAPLVEQSKKRLSLLGMSNSAIRGLERDATASPPRRCPLPKASEEASPKCWHSKVSM